MVTGVARGAFVWAVVLACVSAAMGQEWTGRVRGSWMRAGEPQAGDVVLAGGASKPVIVVAAGEHSAVRQAAEFLAGDIEKLSGQRPEIAATAPAGAVAIHLVTLSGAQELPAGVARDKLEGQWEAYQMLTGDDAQSVWLVGSNFRGTAFAAYTLSERLGVDPLYRWTGYQPERQARLVLKKTNHFVGAPTIKYRGMFHDDEDILPRPYDYHGYPLQLGDVPLAWYQAYFETALRLRLNMVAPYVRVHRRFEVQKTASDWGLYFTSHHYDILLSNPWGFKRFKLAEQRGVSGDWDWLTNRDGMLAFWRGGVEENGQLDCIWPVGLRGTQDSAYSFPKGMSPARQNEVFREVIDAQIAETKRLAAADKQPPLFHFTLYNEMLNKYLGSGGKFAMPPEVILVWADDNDGRMRALPGDRGQWKHGVYYHLAFLGGMSKQVFHIVPPDRVATEFKKIVATQATEYALVNVSELREFVMEMRMAAEICWDASTALADTPVPDFQRGVLLPGMATRGKQPAADAPTPSGARYLGWWCREYFGDAAAADAAEAYRRYYAMLNWWDRQWYAADKVTGALGSLRKKFAGQAFSPALPSTLPALQSMAADADAALEAAGRAANQMGRAQRQFFFENLAFPLLIVDRQAHAAVLLVEAMNEPDQAKAWGMCEQAMRLLEKLEGEILRAERPPFEHWYCESWIRAKNSSLNIHRPYEQLRAFIAGGGTADLDLPEERVPGSEAFLPLLQGK